MINKNIVFLVVFLLLTAQTILAQSDDFALRSGIELKKDFRKGFGLSMEYQYRRNQNLSRFQASYFSISPSYKINKYFNTSAEFRYGTSHVWDRYRYAVYLTAKNNVKKFGFSTRIGYLYETFAQELSDIDQFPSTNNIRFRLQFDYKISKKLKASISSEPIISLQNGMDMRQMRNIMELDWEFIKNNEISISYLQMPQFSNALYLSSNHILQLNYIISIAKRSKL